MKHLITHLYSESRIARLGIALGLTGILFVILALGIRKAVVAHTATSNMRLQNDVSQSVDASTTHLLIATHADNWPMAYISGTRIIGHDIDLMNAIASEISVTVIYTDVPRDNIFNGLVAGEYNAAIAALTVTAESEELIDFTLPYVTLNENENIAIAVGQSNDSLRWRMNGALGKLRINGTLEAIRAAIAADMPQWQPRLPGWFVLAAPTGTAGTLIYTDTQGLIVIQVPVGAIPETSMLIYSPVETITAPSPFSFTGHAFDLDAFQDGTLFLPGLSLKIPIAVTLYYTDTDVAGLDEDTLMLGYWNEVASAWQDAACGPYDRRPDENRLTVSICRLGRFAFLGQEHTIFLPLVLANHQPPVVALSRMNDHILDIQARGVITAGHLVFSASYQAASFQQDGVMTYGGYQYVGWYTQNRHAMIARRQLPHGAWETIELDYLLVKDDPHNTLSLGVSPNDGRIHIAFSTHSPAIRYTRSVPGLATEPELHTWSAEKFEPTMDHFPGASMSPNFTYPRFERLGEKLLMGWRSGRSGDGIMELLEYNNDGTWTHLGAYTSNTGSFFANDGRSDNRNAYLNGFTADPGGRIHIAWVWREDDRSTWCTDIAVGNHGVGYAYSDDGGLTWKNDQDQQIAETGSGDLISIDDDHIVDEISINAALANQESQEIDGNGLFHTIVSFVPERFWDGQGTLCVTDFAAARLANGRPHHLWRDENGVWTRTEIPFLQGRVGRSKLVFDSYNTAYVILPDLRIVAASADSQWTDWRLVFDAADVSIYGEITIDRQRVKLDGVLSVLYREALDGENPAPVRLVDFQLGSRAPHQPKASKPLPMSQLTVREQ